MIVIIESPFRSADPKLKQTYKEYLKKAVLHSIQREETPFASHAFYTQFLDDDTPSDRILGIKLGFEFHKFADILAVYSDYGISEGMKLAIEKSPIKEIQYRKIL